MSNETGRPVAPNLEVKENSLLIDPLPTIEFCHASPTFVAKSQHHSVHIS